MVKTKPEAATRTSRFIVDGTRSGLRTLGVCFATPPGDSETNERVLIDPLTHQDTQMMEAGNPAGFGTEPVNEVETPTEPREPRTREILVDPGVAGFERVKDIDATDID
ncbi:hypothetical protein LWI28_005046 [Acer negundo]|uniref:Uncharacterized protein n=1 Tax=Acer negundo TaxID=4023 RepID=A0AAD5IXH2_ACENE|nr:hypothetical protein LWI28_005046 [Acer negundo]